MLEICQASFQKSSFRFLSRESQRPFVRCARLRQPSQPPAQIRSRRMCKVEVHQITAREDGVYQMQAGQWPVTHRHRHSAIQLDYG